MKIEQAVIEDMPEILKLQKLAYQSEAELYNDFTITPLTQNLEGMKEDFSCQTFLKAVIEDRIVGSVRAHEKEGTCYIGRLIVHPDFQNQGIATKLMNEIENTFKDAERFELFTGYKSHKNIHLYKKLGYKKFKTKRVNSNLTFIFFEKSNLNPLRVIK